MLNPNSPIYAISLMIYPICATLFQISPLNIGFGVGENVVALILFGLIIRGYIFGLSKNILEPYHALLALLGNFLVMFGFSILVRSKIFMISILIPILGMICAILRCRFMDVITFIKVRPKWNRTKYVENKEYIALVLVLVALIGIELSRLFYVYEEY